MPFDDGKKTVSGSIAHTDDAATKVPFVSVKCGIAPTLTGKSAVECTQTGKNIYDKNAGVYDDTYFNQDGTTSHYADVEVSWIRVKPNTKYTFSLGATPSRTTFLRWINCDKDKNFISRPVASYGSQNFPYTVTTPNDCQWVQLAINEYPAAQISSNDWIIQIEENSSATAYEAYNATQYTATLGRTIYGGSAEVVNGTGTETYANTSLTNKNYYYSSTLQRFDCTLDGVISSGYIDDFIPPQGYTIDHALIINASDAPDYTMCIYGGKLYIKNLSCSSVPELVSDMSGKYLTYSLATPTDFTFTPITPTPETVGKVNNVYCDTGNTELTYYDNAHGFSEITVNRCGKNLWDEQWEVGGINDATGVPNSDTDKIRSKTFSIMKGGATYYAKAPNNIRVLFYASDYSFLSETNNIMNATFTAPSNCVYFKIRGTVAYGTTYNNDIAINYPSTETAYEEYSRESKTAYLHKVIYGGQADVVRGTCEPKNLFDVGATPGNYEDPAKIESVENGVVSMTIRGSGSTYTYRKQDLTDKGMVTLSLKSSVSRSRLFVEFRSLDDTKWLDNNDITIAESGWSYNQYYHGWYSETASTSITKTITIPNCLYWRVGIGFASNAAEVGTVQTLSDIMVEKASSASEYTPYFEPFTFPPISMETDEGENTLFANEGGSAITYRKDTE